MCLRSMCETHMTTPHVPATAAWCCAKPASAFTQDATLLLRAEVQAEAAPAGAQASLSLWQSQEARGVAAAWLPGPRACPAHLAAPPGTR